MASAARVLVVNAVQVVMKLVDSLLKDKFVVFELDSLGLELVLSLCQGCPEGLDLVLQLQIEDMELLHLDFQVLDLCYQQLSLCEYPIVHLLQLVCFAVDSLQRGLKTLLLVVEGG